MVKSTIFLILKKFTIILQFNTSLSYTLDQIISSLQFPNSQLVPARNLHPPTPPTTSRPRSKHSKTTWVEYKQESDWDTHLVYSGSCWCISDEGSVLNMKRINKSPDDVDPTKFSDFDAHTVLTLKDSYRKSGLSSMKIMGIFVVFLMVFSVLFSVSLVLKDPPSDDVLEGSQAVTLPVTLDNGNVISNDFSWLLI